jgi:hypothetical protein
MNTDPRIGQLRVEMRGGSIIVTLPDTSYAVTYCMSLKGRHLHARSLPTQYDRGAGMTTEEFLTEAWQLAHLRARELGWIA